MLFKVSGKSISVNVPTLASLEARVAERFARRQGFALATINLDHLVKLRSSEAFRDAYVAQDFVVADGNPIVWLSRLAGQRVALIPGSDAILPLARVAARNGVGIALVGSTDEALAGAKDFLQREVRDLKVVCTIAPPMGFDAGGAQGAGVIEQVAASGARICFVALGAPKQEIFAAQGRSVAPEIGFASIGAGLDFFAGTQTRAPEWARRFALEWFWRMINSPARLGPRYLKCIAILPVEFVKAFGLRFTAKRG